MHAGGVNDGLVRPCPAQARVQRDVALSGLDGDGEAGDDVEQSNRGQNEKQRVAGKRRDDEFDDVDDEQDRRDDVIGDVRRVGDLCRAERLQK